MLLDQRGLYIAGWREIPGDPFDSAGGRRAAGILHDASHFHPPLSNLLRRALPGLVSVITGAALA